MRVKKEYLDINLKFFNLGRVKSKMKIVFRITHDYDLRVNTTI